MAWGDTNIDGNTTISQSSLESFTKSIACGDDAEVTPPLGVVAHVPQCVVDGGTTIPVSADVTSVYANSNPAIPNASVGTVTVTVAQSPPDGGAPIVVSGADLCAGVTPGAPGSCGGGNPGACGCTPETLPLAPTSVAVGNCVNVVKVTAIHDEITEDGGISAAESSDTRTVIVDPSHRFSRAPRASSPSRSPQDRIRCQ